jgi:hypothetical protein
MLGYAGTDAREAKVYQMKMSCLVAPIATLEKPHGFASADDFLQTLYTAKLGKRTTVRECVEQSFSGVPHIATIGKSIVLFDYNLTGSIVEYYAGENGEHEPSENDDERVGIYWHELAPYNTGKEPDELQVQFVSGGLERRYFSAALAITPGAFDTSVGGRGVIQSVELEIVKRVAREIGRPSLVEEWCEDSLSDIWSASVEGTPERQSARRTLIHSLVFGILSDLVGMPFLGDTCQSGPGYVVQML